MSTQTPDDYAAELATRIVAARVGAAAGRPSLAEGQDAAAYFRAILRETRHALGLPPVADPDAGA